MTGPEAKVGKFVGETGLVAGLTGGAGSLVSRLGLPAVGRAIQAGGLGPMADFGATGLPSYLRIPTQLAGKAAAGATAGAIGGYAIDPESTDTAATIGAAIPFAGSAAARVLGINQPGGILPEWVRSPIVPWLDQAIEAVTGRSARVRAGDIMRRAASPQTRAALQASPGVPAGVATAGVNDPTFQALAATAEKNLPGEFGAATQARLRQDENQLAGLAGGANATASRLFRRAGKEDLNTATQGMQRRSLHRVNEAGEQTTYWQREFDAAQQRIDELSRQLGQYRAPIQTPGLPSPVPLQTELVTNTVARQAAELRLQALEAAGMRPLDIGNLTDYLDTVATTPGPRADQLQRNLMTELSGRIRRLAELNGGIIDAEDLYQIRKTGINDVIDELLGGRDPIANRQRAAGLVSAAKEHIDAAIERAGGREWRQYLDTYTRGSHALDQHEFADFLRQQYNQSPAEFVAIVRGERPQVVERFFGTNRFNIFEEMDAHPRYGGQNMMSTLNRIADRVERELPASSLRSQQMMSMQEQAARGTESLNNILQQNRSAWEWVRQFFATKAGVGGINELLSRIDANPEARQIIARAMLNSRTAEEAMQVMPLDLVRRVLNAAGTMSRYGMYGPGAAQWDTERREDKQ